MKFDTLGNSVPNFEDKFLNTLKTIMLGVVTTEPYALKVATNTIRKKKNRK
jgi:hypothetical protein